MDILIDSLLAILTIYLAFRCMLAPKLTKAVFVFFAFGLILALAWIRLGAVDVAIAEAAIASGFMGVLLLDSLRDFSSAFSINEEIIKGKLNQTVQKSNKFHWVTGMALGIGLVLFLLISLQAIWKIPEGGGLTAIAEAELPESGVEHPVTAV